MSSRELQLMENMQPPTYTVWFDAQGLMRRLGVHVQTANPGTGESVSVVADFSDYGAPVHISAPAPSDTISYASAVQSAGSSG